MRKILSTFAAAGALALAAVAATPAAAVDFVGGYTTSYHNGSSNGLNIDLTNNGVGSLDFDLNATFPWDFEVVKLFDIWAGEGIGFDDFEADPIQINFTFTQPSVGGDVSGSTQGNFGWVIFPNYGSVSFTDNPETFNFGGTGVLKGLVFADNLGTFGQGQNNSAGVYAKFWLESMPSAVPEPATWAMMITGFGLAGVALRRRRSLGAIAA